MQRYQRGVTFLGWMFLLAPIALVVYAGIRLTPLYLEYMKIARTLEQVKEEFKGEEPTPQRMRSSIERRFDVESVTVIGHGDVKITKENDGYILDVEYSQSAPYMSNLSLQLDFHKTVTVE
jgi:hypothetical protein